MKKRKILIMIVSVIALICTTYIKKDNKVSAYSPSVLVSTEYVEEVSVGDIVVATNYLNEESYNWNLNAEILMRDIKENRTLQDTFALASQSKETLEQSARDGGVAPAYIIIPYFPEITVNGYYLYSDNGISHYGYAKITYSSRNGGASGYYSFNGANLVWFSNNYTFYVPGTYTFYVYDNNNECATRTIVIDDLSIDFNGEYQELVQINPVPVEGFDLTAGYEVNYARHYLYVSSSGGRTIELNSKFIWDSVPSYRNVDYFGLVYDNGRFYNASGNLIYPSYLASAEYTFKDNIISVEFDDHHWVSGYTTSSETYYKNQVDYIADVSDFGLVEKKGMYVMWDLPDDEYCEDTGWEHLKTRELIGAEFNIHQTIAFIDDDANLTNTNEFFFGSSYLHTESHILVSPSFSISISLEEDGASTSASLIFEISSEESIESVSFVAVYLANSALG